METSSKRKFRFGITGRGESVAEWRDFARKAEDLGYSTLVIGDHVDRFMAPLLALVAAAQATTRLRFGAQVLVNDFRHPAIVAKEAATADVMTDGRFELGVGVGSTPQEYQMIGLPIETPGVRVERVRESVRILKAFFTQETVNYNGRHYQIAGLAGYPKPVQRPHMPLMIGANGPRTLRLAAQEADIISILTQLSAGTRASGSMSEKVGIVREAAGPRYEKCELHTWFTRVQIDAEGPLGSLPANQEGFPGLAGSRDQVIEQLLAEREQNDISYITVTGPAIDVFAPVVARLAGT